MERTETPAVELGVVIPCHNEAEVVTACHGASAKC